MNVIFISPHFPRHFYQFCARLKERGVTVLGIGDCPWEGIGSNCQNALTDYRFVHSLKDYDMVYRAVAEYISRYGRIDFVESENEYNTFFRSRQSVLIPFDLDVENRIETY